MGREISKKIVIISLPIKLVDALESKVIWLSTHTILRVISLEAVALKKHIAKIKIVLLLFDHFCVKPKKRMSPLNNIWLK